MTYVYFEDLKKPIAHRKISLDFANLLPYRV